MFLSHIFALDLRRCGHAGIDIDINMRHYTDDLTEYCEDIDMTIAHIKNLK